MSDQIQLYDVVIFRDADKQVVSVVYRDMPLEKGTYNARKRAETAWTRIDAVNYSVAIIPACESKKGDVVKAENFITQ